MRESQVEQYFKKKAEQHGWLCYKFTSPSNAGVPDRLIIKDGHTIYVELKAPNQTPRKLQQAVFRKMREHGATIVVLDSKPAVDTFFQEENICAMIDNAP